MSALAAQVCSYVESVQRQTASLTDAYLARAATTVAGRTIKPAGVVKVAGLRLGVEHVDVYKRPAAQYRYLISTDVDPAKAAAAAIQRGATIAVTDTDLAFRGQTAQFMAARDMSWRRVVRPETAAGVTCGMCVHSAGAVHDPSTPMALHPRCACGVLPVIGENDPAAAMNNTDLTGLYNQVGNDEADKLRAVIAVTHQHGELGALLGVEGQHWRSPSDVDNDAN